MSLSSLIHLIFNPLCPLILITLLYVVMSDMFTYTILYYNLCNLTSLITYCIPYILYYSSAYITIVT